MTAQKKSSSPQREYENFKNLTERLLRVPHDEITAKFDEERNARKRKKNKK